MSESTVYRLSFFSLFAPDCQMSCHVHCKDKAVPTCPLPPGQGTLRVRSFMCGHLHVHALPSPPPLPISAKLPFGIDIHHGVGTACEGWIKIPKPGGVRRGWQRAYAIVCDFKVFLHEPSNDIHTPAVGATHIFDIRYMYSLVVCLTLLASFLFICH